MHNLLLKSISKEPVIVVQVNVRSKTEFLVVMHLLPLYLSLSLFYRVFSLAARIYT